MRIRYNRGVGIKLTVFRNGSRPHRVHDRSRTSHLAVTRWLNGLLGPHQSAPLPLSLAVFGLSMISSARVFFETLGAIGRVSKEVEKAHPRPSEEALENAHPELDLYEN